MEYVNNDCRTRTLLVHFRMHLMVDEGLGQGNCDSYPSPRAQNMKQCEIWAVLVTTRVNGKLGLFIRGLWRWSFTDWSTNVENDKDDTH